MPRARLQVERVDVREGSARVLQTAVTPINVHLVVVQGGTAVSSRRGSSNCGFLVFSDVLVTADAFPLGLLGVIVPAVVESLRG